MNEQTELLELASTLALATGRFAAEERSKVRVVTALTKSTATDMVTEFDRASEALIVKGILTARANDSILGEEGTQTVGSSGVQWTIDPLDGTTNFLYGLPGWAVSIAVTSDRGSQVGVVYVPSVDELFTASAGNGAFLNGKRLHCSTTDTAALALIATGFSYSVARRRRQAQRLAVLLPQVRDIRRAGAASVDLCHLAAGRVDVYFEEWLEPWDCAAGEVIAREAGCLLGSIDGGPVRPASVLAANPQLFATVQAMISAIDETLNDTLNDTLDD